MVVKRENGDGVYWAVGEFEAERARKSWKSWTLKWYFFCILEKVQGRKKTENNDAKMCDWLCVWTSF